MTVLTGQNFYLEFAGTAITSLYREFDDGMERESSESTAGFDAVRNYVPTLFKVEPKLKAILDDASAALEKFEIGTSGTLIWGPHGNSAGKPKWGIACRVKSAPNKRKYDEAVEIEVGFEVTTGTWTYDGRTDTF